MKRLNKFISECGICSRREADNLIISGRVVINGKVVSELGTKVSEKDIVEVDGKVLKEEKKEYYLLYKPREVISTTHDEVNRKSVVDLVKSKGRVYPVGRLDYDTTGIILLTNDGELSNILTHPKRDIEKMYVAKVKGFFKKGDAITLSNGIVLDGVMTKKASFKLKKYNKKTDTSYVNVIITEGRNHQVKNMFNYLGYDVLKLKRERYAFLDLSGLKSGEYRALSLKEVKKLYSLK